MVTEFWEPEGTRSDLTKITQLLKKPRSVTEASVFLPHYEQWLNISLPVLLQLCLRVHLYSQGTQTGDSAPRGSFSSLLQWPTSSPNLGPEACMVRPSAELRPESFMASVCRPGWPRLKADSQHAANRPVGRVACTMCRTPRPSTAVHRIGRGTVSVRRLLFWLRIYFSILESETSTRYLLDPKRLWWLACDVSHGAGV